MTNLCQPPVYLFPHPLTTATALHLRIPPLIATAGFNWHITIQAGAHPSLQEHCPFESNDMFSSGQVWQDSGSAS